MILGTINKNNTPHTVILIPEKSISNNSNIIQRYLMPLGKYKNGVHIIGVPIPLKGTMKRVDFEEEWEPIKNYCETMGVTNIMCTIPIYMKMITRSKKAYRFEVAQGSHEEIDDFFIYPLLNFQVLSFQPNKIKLLQRSLNHLVDVLSGNTSDENEALKLDFNLIYKTPDKVEQVLKQLLSYDKLTCDIETTGLRFEYDKILTISFSWNKKSAVCIVVHEQYTDEETSLLIKSLLKKFFTDYYAKGGVLIGHNFASFDLPFIVHDVMRGRDFTDTHYKYINEANIDDTLVMAYLTMNSTDRVPKGLKEIAYPIMGNYDKDIDQSKLVDYPLVDVATYNNLDCIANWYVYDRLMLDMEEHQELFNRYKPVLRTIAKIKMNGFSVDPTRIKEAQNKLRPLLDSLYNKLLTFPSIRGTILNINDDALAKYNASHVKQKALEDFDEVFNPNSTNHKRILFMDMLGEEVFKKSKKTGKPSYDKEVLIKITEVGSDEAKQVANTLLEFSSARIVESNFLKNMEEYAYEVAPNDFRIFTNFNVIGTISGRMSSSGTVNFLNLPATGSVWSGLVKSCFTTPPNYIFASGDLNNLEGRSLVNVSKDESKYNIIANGFDEHSLAALKYFPDEFADRGINIDITDKTSVNSVKDVAGDLRQIGKPMSFKLAYLGEYGIDPAIYKAYWDMFKGVRAYYDKHIAFAEEHGYVISEFSGLKLATPNIHATDIYARESEIRTLCNFLIQSSSFMLLEYLSNYQDWIESVHLEEKVLVSNTIYDSVDMYIIEDINIIKEVEANFIPIMSKDLLEDQLVPMVMDFEIGRSWEDQTAVPRHPTTKDIKEILKQ